jgi:hypothetical protein
MAPGDSGILLRNTSNGGQLESEVGRLLRQAEKLAFSSTLIHLGKGGFLVRLSGGDQVIEDSCQFVSSGRDRCGSTQPSSHSTEVLSEVRLATMKGL